MTTATAKLAYMQKFVRITRELSFVTLEGIRPIFPEVDLASRNSDTDIDRPLFAPASDSKDFAS